MASDSGRRPKGVVGCVCMILCLVQAKEICSPKRRRLLTAIRGSEILNLLQNEKGFRDVVSGAFSFAVYPFSMAKLSADNRPGLKIIHAHATESSVFEFSKQIRQSLIEECGKFLLLTHQSNSLCRPFDPSDTPPARRNEWLLRSSAGILQSA